MKRVQDIYILDSNLKSQYVNDFLNENYNDAFNLINNDNFETKKITYDFFEELSSKLYNLENFYFQNVPEFLSDKLEEIQYFINNFIFLGEWNSSTVYKAYNLVSYNDSVYMYTGENPESGNVPTSGETVWLKLDIRGKKGEIGIGLNYIGNWDSSLSYNQYDVVFYNNSLWACKVVNQNIIPQDGTYWDEVFKVYKAEIENYSEVVNPYNGLICFEII